MWCVSSVVDVVDVVDVVVVVVVVGGAGGAVAKPQPRDGGPNAAGDVVATGVVVVGGDRIVDVVAGELVGGAVVRGEVVDVTGGRLVEPEVVAVVGASAVVVIVCPVLGGNVVGAADEAGRRAKAALVAPRAIKAVTSATRSGQRDFGDLALGGGAISTRI